MKSKKLPKSIKDKIDKVSLITCNSKELIAEIEDWFSKNGYDTERMRTGNGYSLEEMESGYGVDFNFIEQCMKEQDYEKKEKKEE